jgi:flagellar motility protein MotE (MotC chaperone)
MPSLPYPEVIMSIAMDQSLVPLQVLGSLLQLFPVSRETEARGRIAATVAEARQAFEAGELFQRHKIPAAQLQVATAELAKLSEWRASVDKEIDAQLAAGRDPTKLEKELAASDEKHRGLTDRVKRLEAMVKPLVPQLDSEWKQARRVALQVKTRECGQRLREMAPGLAKLLGEKIGAALAEYGMLAEVEAILMSSGAGCN